MKKTTLVLVVLMQLFSITVMGQRYLVKTYEEFQELQHIDVKGKSHHLSESNIKGSPYLNDHFVKGEVLTDHNILYQNIPMRYNIYNDDVEFRNSKGKVLSIAFPSNIKQLSIGKAVFEYRPYREDQKHIRRRYFLVINRGKALGLVAYRVEFQEAQPALAYKDAQPPMFIRKPNYLYVTANGKPAIKVTKKKALLAYLGHHKKEMEDFMKKEKIRLQRTDDLKRFLDYYNSLPAVSHQ